MSELDRWRALQATATSLANPFLAPEFTVVAGRFLSRSQVGIIEDGPAVEGFFPHERRRPGIGRPIGGGLADCEGVVRPPHEGWDWPEVLAGCGLGVWECGHLVADQVSPSGDLVLEPSPVINIASGYDHYLEQVRSRSRKVVKSTLAKGRRLERDLGPVRFEFDSRDRVAFRAVLGWKSAQYRRTGRRDRFARDWGRSMVEDLFDTRHDGCTGTLSLLWAGDRLVAGHFGLRSPTVLACWFPAYDVDLARYSPGLVLHLHMAESAAARGIDRLDLGKGHAEYKESLKTGDGWVGAGQIERRSVVALARRVQRSPRRRVERFVLDRPHLRLRARRTLRRLGSLRRP